MSKTLHYKGACEDLLHAAIDFLCPEKDSSGLIDLSDCIVVLPGKNMIRELNRELAKAGQGIFPPEMLTPSSILRFGMDCSKMASDMEQLQIWLSVLNRVNPEDYKELHLDLIGGQDPSLIRHIAADLMKLRNELSRNGHTIASAAAALEETSDASRWKKLTRLETAFQQGLKDADLTDPTTELLAAVDHTAAFREYRKLFLIATPDLPPIAIKRLKNVLAQTDIHIHIFITAPDPEETDSKEHDFDEWGQIIPEKWKDRALPINDTYHTLHPVKDPAGAAELAAKLVQQHGVFDTEKTITAIADPTVFPDFEKAFSRFRKEDSGEHLSVYDPAGVPMKKLRIVPVLKLLDALGKDTSPATVNLFLRNHDLAAYCVRNAKFNFTDEMLAAADQYFLAKLPDMIHTGLPDPDRDRYQIAPQALKRLFELLIKRHRLFADGRETGVKPIRKLLKDIFFAESYPPVLGVAFSSEETEVRNVLSNLERSRMFNDLPCREVLELLILTLQDQVCYPEHEQDALEICGFLDLPFKKADEIVLCGINDGLIPEKTGQNTFLTDTKRTLLGLPDNGTRHARDCFYLCYLLQKTAHEGKKMHLIAWEFNQDRTPARFSPLLFNGSNDELLKRIRDLYPKVEEKTAAPQHYGSSTITLQADFTNAFVKKHSDGTEQLILSVTDFKSFLESPLRAFFSRSEQMNRIDYERLDLDNADFGTVCHAVLEKIKNTFGAEKEDLYKSMEAELASCMKQMFGYPLPVLLEIQQDILKNRLYHSAQKIADDARGFTCIETEWKLGGREQNGIVFHDAVIRGKIDRIEWSKDGRILRLIDFKTFNKKKSPAEEHLHAGRDSLHFTDLQLPLYKLLLPLDEAFWKTHPELDRNEIRIVCGYFCLPTAVTETGYIMWDDLDDIMDFAEEQTKEIIDMLKEMQKNNVCYNDSVKTISFDDFADILLPDKEKALPTVTFNPFELVSWQKDS